MTAPADVVPIAIAIATDLAPAPAGAYSQAIRAGDTVYLAGQTPRTPAGERLLGAPLEVQVRQAMDNLVAVAAAAGGTLADAVKVTLYVRPGIPIADVDRVYREFVSAPFPARTAVVSDLATGDVEVDAVLWLPRSDGSTTSAP